jgi:hypothetical protein
MRSIDLVRRKMPRVQERSKPAGFNEFRRLRENRPVALATVSAE